MSNRLWWAFAVLMVGTASVLYLLGFRWYDHEVNAVGALVIIAVMGAIIVQQKRGQWK
jgi:hypothetical protein